MVRFMLAIAMTVTSAALGLASCQARQPTAQEQADLCDIFEDRRSWYRSAAEAERAWGAPIALQMAIMQGESSFDADARPPRGRMFFGLLPGARPSSAYGYAQAVDGTWDLYKRASGNGGAERDDFDDAVDFIAWYASETQRQTGARFSEASAHYLAYHEGWTGYRRGTYLNKAWLRDKAARVGATAARYDRQLDQCEGRLRRNWIPFF
ncbi:MAG: transglycosylase SLT domain-containing protein [Pseudomonadota bacterium]